MAQEPRGSDPTGYRPPVPVLWRLPPGFGKSCQGVRQRGPRVTFYQSRQCLRVNRLCPDLCELVSCLLWADSSVAMEGPVWLYGHGGWRVLQGKHHRGRGEVFGRWRSYWLVELAPAANGMTSLSLSLDHPRKTIRPPLKKTPFSFDRIMLHFYYHWVPSSPKLPLYRS